MVSFCDCSAGLCDSRLLGSKILHYDYDLSGDSGDYMQDTGDIRDFGGLDKFREVTLETVV